jgi:2-keto-4-pentenoate hydratase/2-oxohepta-3-ene-1,7-dioic acid hydratase in catechol pathway
LKLVRFVKNIQESYAVEISKTQLLNLPTLSKILKQPIPQNLEEIIHCGNEGAQTLELLIQNSTETAREKATLELTNVRVLAPITRPPKIICLGSNYCDHAAELNSSVPDEPVIFMKPRTTIVGPDGYIVKPAFVKELDYEAELAIIIGKKGKNIFMDDVKNHIFGCTCFNDVSARDIQFKDKLWTRGKSFDTFAPMGPCITLAS